MNDSTTATQGMPDPTASDWAQERYDDALHAELERLRAEVERLREALHAIRWFEPDCESLGTEFFAEVSACAECEVWRRKQHPIQSMCHAHVRQAYANKDARDHARASQYLAMKDIARNALDSGHAETPPEPEHDGSSSEAAS